MSSAAAMSTNDLEGPMKSSNRFDHDITEPLRFTYSLGNEKAF
jgi:hypothetical protein